MSGARSTPRRARPLRGGAATRLVAALAAVGCCAVGLSACRTIGPSADAQKAKAAVARVAPTPTIMTVPDAPVGTTPPYATTPADAAPTSADQVAPTDPAARSGSAATTIATTPATSPDTSASTVSQPPKLVVDKPWVVVGRPFVVDTTAPRGTTTGLTGFQLVFRTRGDFRGVRAGTPVTDERHYKVGLITVPELPAYVPGGQANLQLGDRNKSKGRYCWIATLGKQDTPGKIVFPARANGVAMAIVFDLHSAPIQNRTAPVFVRTKAGEQPSELQDKLGCHLNYF